MGRSDDFSPFDIEMMKDDAEMMKDDTEMMIDDGEMMGDDAYARIFTRSCFRLRMIFTFSMSFWRSLVRTFK